jgi:hypothetical protein
MTIPTFLLALLIALLCGVVFHVFRGGDGWRLLLYLGLSVLGFAIGQGISLWRGWSLYTFGPLDIGMGLIGSVVVLALGEWLSRTQA